MVNNSIIYHLEDDIIQDCAVVEGGGHDDGAYEDCLFTNCLVALPWRQHVEYHRDNIDQNGCGGVEVVHWVGLWQHR